MGKPTNLRYSAGSKQVATSFDQRCINGSALMNLGDGFPSRIPPNPIGLIVDPFLLAEYHQDRTM